MGEILDDLATDRRIEEDAKAQRETRNAALEEAAKVCEMKMSEVKLMCGELTAGEARTCRALLTGVAALIRARRS